MTRSLRKWVAALIAVAAAFATGSACAEPLLYSATVRLATGGSPTAPAGSLYVIDPATAKTRMVGALRVNGKPIGVTGIAVHPKTGVVFGVTAGSSVNYPNALVIIDAASGEASLVGETRVPTSDIAFSPDGHLYMWLTQTNQVGEINIGTGRVRAIGTPSQPSWIEAGISVDARGFVFVTPEGATGPLEQRDPATGAVMSSISLSNAPYLSSLNSLAFSKSGELFGVNSNMGTPAHTALVKIDLGTGVITKVGDLPEDTDCLAFVDAPRTSFLARQSNSTLVIGGSALAGVVVLGVALFMRRRTRRQPPPGEAAGRA
ncbi:MAG TPA: hypothetical protein VNU21_24570 [Usitatibacter sp.]|nr:hypothetical protein [Usitatibacter sp.]